MLTNVKFNVLFSKQKTVSKKKKISKKVEVVVESESESESETEEEPLLPPPQPKQKVTKKSAKSTKADELSWLNNADTTSNTKTKEVGNKFPVRLSV